MTDLHWSTIAILLILLALAVRVMIKLADRGIKKYWNNKERFGP